MTPPAILGCHVQEGLGRGTMGSPTFCSSLPVNHENQLPTPLLLLSPLSGTAAAASPPAAPNTGSGGGAVPPAASGPTGGAPGMPGGWNGMLGGGGAAILVMVIPRPSMIAWENGKSTAGLLHIVVRQDLKTKPQLHKLVCSRKQRWSCCCHMARPLNTQLSVLPGPLLLRSQNQSIHIHTVASQPCNDAC